MKQLICAKDVEAWKEQGREVYSIDENTIITPSARDTAKALGITFSQKKETEHTRKSDGKEISSEQIYQVLKILMGKGLLNDMFHPYESECDSSGLKVIKGSTVQMETFDTGNSHDKVFYQELVSKKESHISAGFLDIDHSSFEQKSTGEETVYVMEGTLTVTINQKIYTAVAGDVLFVPSGSNVIWGSPDRAKVFCTVYPVDESKQI